MFCMIIAKRVILAEWKSTSCFKKSLDDMVSCLYLEESKCSSSDSYWRFVTICNEAVCVYLCAPLECGLMYSLSELHTHCDLYRHFRHGSCGDEAYPGRHGRLFATLATFFDL